jgi:hypothetical protein
MSAKRPGNPGRTDRPGERVIPRYELQARLSLIPADTRDTTGRLLGDPLPGDTRRQMFPGKDLSGRDGHWR